MSIFKNTHIRTNRIEPFLVCRHDNLTKLTPSPPQEDFYEKHIIIGVFVFQILFPPTQDSSS